MKKVLLLFVNVVTVTCLLHAQQKPALDSSVYSKWLSFGWFTEITNDGKYMEYSVQNQSAGSQTSFIESTDGHWKLEGPSGNGAVLTPDSKYAFYKTAGDSLCIITLGTSERSYISQVGNFLLPKVDTKGHWLAYQKNNSAKELVLHNLETGDEKTFDQVEAYSFSDNGKVLLLQLKMRNDNDNAQSLNWVDLDNWNKTTLYEGTGIENIMWDKTNTQLAFTIEKKVNDQAEKSFWYYKEGMGKAVMLADNNSDGIESGFSIDGMQNFNKNGSSIIFRLKKAWHPVKPDPNAVKLNLWSYTDPMLQPQQLNFINVPPDDYEAVINIQDRRIIRLEHEGENNGWNYDVTDAGNYALVSHTVGDAPPGETSWNPAAERVYYLVSTRQGERKPMKVFDRFFGGLTPSPEEKYIVYFDPKQKSFFSYEIATGVSRNITRGIVTTWYDIYRDDLPGEKNYPRTARAAGWLKGDQAVLLYDQHDIWEADPSGKKPPVNLTNGYGRKHNIVFYLLNHDGPPSSRIFSSDDKLILTAFNETTKDNGFYSKNLDKAGDPELLTMGHYLYEIPDNPYIPDGCNFTPVKAQDAQMYIVRRESATEFPNFFSTTDFKTFTRLTDLHPESDYNWYTTELHTWKSLDGKPLQGILFKPENFDPEKKYPVIFYYYERRSDGLNAYIQPENLCNGCSINIPTYVSNGYLVFEPDIYYTVGNPMQGTYNDVVSAAQYVSRLPFVNRKKMGIQGCSWGGFQTDYLVTHTHLFAAACTASGESDLMSFYGSIDGGIGDTEPGAGGVQQDYLENGQGRMGSEPWQTNAKYIENSAIYKADRVTTPVLIMHTTKDGRCPFYDAVAFFTALRRLGKKSWMLEYTDGDHGVDGKSANDFSFRMMQFFDYYLKDARAPAWMVKGIPARLKGIDNGYELEAKGTNPGPGLLTNHAANEISNNNEAK